jgi:molecular chaperone HtpG
MSKHTHAFQAEVKQILHLVTHSLYSNKEIFLRELVIQRLRRLRQAALRGPGQRRAVRGRAQPGSAHAVRQAEAQDADHPRQRHRHERRGSRSPTWAPSPRAARANSWRQAGARQKKDANLIGQFGVGFYSGFIVADRITVETRRAGLPPAQGVRWSSEGTGEFEVETIDKAARGTDVILHLREGEDEFLQAWKLKSIVSKYSDHISLPILMQEGRVGRREGVSR